MVKQIIIMAESYRLSNRIKESETFYARAKPVAKA
jgi:hypothetical protein